MKRLWLILLMVGVCNVTHPYAADVTLTWDLNIEEVDGYRVFTKTGEYPYDYATPLWEGTVPPATVVVDDGSTWFFVVRAFKDKCGDPPEPCESADSNEVSYDGTIVVPPIGLQAATEGFSIAWEIINDPEPPQSSMVTLPDGSILYLPRGE